MGVSLFSSNKALAEDETDVNTVSTENTTEETTATIKLSATTTTGTTTEEVTTEATETTTEEVISTPVLNSTIAASGGIKVSWSKVTDATGYAVYRKVSGGSWSRIGTSTSTSYTDTTATAGTTYIYTVRAYKGSFSTAKKYQYSAKYWSGYDKTGITGTYIKMPTISKAQTNASGTALSWSAVSGATGYAVWRRTASGSWSRIGYTTSTSYTDKTALSSGTTYYYTIRAYSGAYATANANTFNSNYWSFYDTTGTKTVYLSNPTLNSTVAANGGINVSWSKVSGVSGYMVYRKTSGGSWSMLGSTTGTSYADKTAAAGTTYYYTVRAYTGNVSTAKKNTYNAAYWGGYDSTGVTGKYIKMPTISSAQTNANGTALSWSAVSGATGYAVWRRTASGSWSRIGYTTSTSYTDKTALTSGTTYYYTIRAYSGAYATANANTFNSNYWSFYDTTGTKTVYLSNPTLNSTAAANGGINVSWSKVSGASGYMVYRKTSSGSWSMLGSTTSTSYTDKTATAGTTYYYTVRAYTGNVSTAKKNTYNAAYWGGYDSTGVTGKYIKMPTISSAQTNANGTALSWSAVSGATGYAVWRRTASGSWSRIGYTTSTSYTDKTALSSGTTYYYTIRAYSGAYATANADTFNSNYWSFYDMTGTKTVYLSNPTLNSATATGSSIKVSWSTVTGASGYAVYRKTSGSSWTMLGTTTSTAYTDTSLLVSDTTYYYTVRAYTGNATTAKKNTYNALYWGGYDSTGVSAEYSAASSSSSTGYLNTDAWLARVISEYLGDTGIACNVFVDNSLALAGGTDYTIANMVKYTSKSAGGVLLNQSYTCSAWATAGTVKGSAVIANGSGWNSSETITLNDNIVSFSYDALEPGDIILYYKSSQSTPSHISIYIGQFDSSDDVINYLVSIGISKSTASSYVKTWGTYYNNNGTYWCIEGGMGSNSQVYICNSTYCIPASSTYTYGTKIVKMN